MATHFAVNPQTGERLMLLDGQWVPATGQSSGVTGGGPKLTEDQGKSQGYARLMVDAERNYQAAQRQGYNPADLRNSTASVLEGLPFGGLDGMGAMLRDEVGDRGRQAEMQWSDAQLKAMSGAASPEQEVKRNVRTYFPRPGENVQDIGPQKFGARTTAFESAKVRAGPAAQSVGAYHQNMPEPSRGKYQSMFQQGRIDPKAPMGSERNPYSPRDPGVLDRLPKGAFVITPDGHFGVVE